MNEWKEKTQEYKESHENGKPVSALFSKAFPSLTLHRPPNPPHLLPSPQRPMNPTLKPNQTTKTRNQAPALLHPRQKSPKPSKTMRRRKNPRKRRRSRSRSPLPSERSVILPPPLLLLLLLLRRPHLRRRKARRRMSPPRLPFRKRRARARRPPPLLLLLPRRRLRRRGDESPRLLRGSLSSIREIVFRFFVFSTPAFAVRLSSARVILVI